MFNIFHKIFYFRSGTLQTAGNLQVFQSTAGRGKSESKGRIEGSYTSMARRMGVFVVFYWSDIVVNGTIGKFIGGTIDIVICCIYTYVHSAKRRTRSQNRYPAQNNASELSLHRNTTARSSARTKHPATPDRREIQSRKKESVGIRKGKGRNDGVRLGERRCVDWVSRRLENVYSLLYTKAVTALFYILSIYTL